MLQQMYSGTTTQLSSYVMASKSRCQHLHVIIAFALILDIVVLADHYGQGIAKSTTSASDPIAFFSWMSTYLPIHCQDQATPCNTTFRCGASGRASLCSNAACTYPSNPTSGGFGLHLVNTSARPYGEVDNWEVEQFFARKLQHAFSNNLYDSFMDFSTVLYADSLDSMIALLQRDTQPHQVRRWSDDMGAVWYSLLVQVSISQVILEIVSSNRPSHYDECNIVSDQLQRLPASVFVANNVSESLGSIMIPLAVSKAVSNISAARDFYVDEMLAAVNHTSSMDGNVVLEAYKLVGANVLVRFVERPVQATYGNFTVRDLEDIKHSAHRMAHMNEFCGVDKYYDNHFATDQSAVKLDVFKANFDKRGRVYHIFGDSAPLLRDRAPIFMSSTLLETRCRSMGTGMRVLMGAAAMP